MKERRFRVYNSINSIDKDARFWLQIAGIYHFAEITNQIFPLGTSRQVVLKHAETIVSVKSFTDTPEITYINLRINHMDMEGMQLEKQYNLIPI